MNNRRYSLRAGNGANTDDETKYVPQFGHRGSGRFTFRNQVHDNMFWSLASGVTVWSGYSVMLLWAHANGVMPAISFAVGCIALGFLCETHQSFESLCAACVELNKACLVPFTISDSPVAIPFDLDEQCTDGLSDEEED